MEICYLKVLTTIMFLLSGIYKLIDPSLSMRKLAECPFVGIKNNKLLIIIIIIAGLWEIIASLAVYFGNKRQNVLGIYSLVVFTILATLLCHFPPMGFKYYAFISNITTLGGLLCLAKLIDGCQSEQ